MAKTTKIFSYAVDQDGKRYDGCGDYKAMIKKLQNGAVVESVNSVAANIHSTATETRL